MDLVKKAFAHQPVGRLPRGELWLGTDLLRKANLEDNLQGHLALVKRLGQDLLCLPISKDLSVNKALGYRYFGLEDLEEASRIGDLFLAAVIDGPFQRLVETKGWMKILTGWKREKDEVTKRIDKEWMEVDRLIKQCLELSVDAIVLAEDLAGEDGPLIDPKDIQALFCPFYTQAVSEIHGKHSYALFHSCGNITRFIPQLVSLGFDGLAAVQHRANDLISIRGKYAPALTLMGGIEAEILEPGEIPSSSMKEYKRLIKYFSAGGGFILCSCSGLYSGDFLERLQELYRIADKFRNSGGRPERSKDGLNRPKINV